MYIVTDLNKDFPVYHVCKNIKQVYDVLTSFEHLYNDLEYADVEVEKITSLDAFMSHRFVYHN